MSGSINKVILVGNLGRDPEARQTQAGQDIIHLSVATEESWRDKATGERKSRTEWHRVVIFNDHLGKVAKDHLSKGSKVYIEGQLQTRKWKDKEGNEKYTTEVVLASFRGELQILESPKKEDAPAGAYADRRNPDRAPKGRDLDDDVPF